MNINKYWHSLGIYRLSRQQELLLQACVLSGQAGLNSLNRWQQTAELENLDNPSSYAILCQLYHNLSANKVENCYMTRLKGVYKQNWYHNQLLLKKLQTVLQALQESQIDSVITANSALAVGYCQDLAQLSIVELDFLIHPQNAQTAIAVLEELGWVQSQTSESIISNEDLSLQFQDRSGTSLSLQGHLFWAMPQEHTDKELWHNSRSCYVGDIDTLILSSTDLLLDLAVRTFCLGQTSTASLFVNAMLLLQQDKEPIDWIRLVTQAQKYQGILPLRNMLIILQRLFEASLPVWVLPALWQMPIARQEFLKYQVLPGNKRAVLQSILWRTANSIEVIK